MAVVLDSSTVLTWILQEPRWQVVDQLLQQSSTDPVLPTPGLAEVVAMARKKGNQTTGPDLASTLSGVGIRFEEFTADDGVVAAGLREMSDANPGPVNPRTGNPSTLSLGDTCILAVAIRLGTAVLTRDQHWAWLKSRGLLPVNIQAF